jgi:hypothetical protein
MNKQAGFYTEIIKRCEKNTDIFYAFNDIFNLLSSAVLLEVEDKYKFWLCHGGFPYDINGESESNKIGSAMKLDLDKNEHIIKLSPSQAIQTRWTDFVNYKVKTKNNIFNKSRNRLGTDPNYIRLNKRHVKEFLDKNSINFIIRGHQDNYYNSYIFANKENADIRSKGSFGISEERQSINNILVYNDKIKSTDKRVGVDGPIARLVADKNDFSSSDYYYINIYKNASRQSKNEIYPVLTISTNTDRLRYLHKDSFILMRFDLTKNNMGDFDQKIFSKLSNLPK